MRNSICKKSGVITRIKITFTKKGSTSVSEAFFDTREVTTATRAESPQYSDLTSCGSSMPFVTKIKGTQEVKALIKQRYGTEIEVQKIQTECWYSPTYSYGP
ncbi:MAG: hypothetical protein Q7T51_00880 [Candidatus Moranbacteria bacterium]|nr:hypothetical protein [Candidatus Moranbacteria bacterium]